jgi:hypothetical protein
MIDDDDEAREARAALHRLLEGAWRRSHGDEAIWSACGPGWFAIVAELHAEVVAIAPEYQLYEVSQKYGALYFRADEVPEAAREAVIACIDRAEARAQGTCEACGRPGRLCHDRGGWLEVVCPAREAAGGYVPAATWSSSSS